MSNKNIMSIGTESNLSDSSTNVQEGGNILSYLFGSNKGSHATEIVLDACENNYPQIVGFIIRNSIIKSYELDYSLKGHGHKNLLHYLVIFCNFVPEMKKLLLDVLVSTNAKKSINNVDDNGNTPAHYSVYFKMNDITDLLVKHGADLTIKNKIGLCIQPESSPVLSKSGTIDFDEEPSDIFEKITKTHTNPMTDENDDSIKIVKIIRRFIPETSESSLGFTANVLDSEEPKKKDIKIKSPKQSKPSGSFIPSVLSATSDDFLENEITDDVVNVLLQEFKTQGVKSGNQMGGKKKIKFI